MNLLPYGQPRAPESSAAQAARATSARVLAAACLAVAVMLCCPVGPARAAEAKPAFSIQATALPTVLDPPTSAVQSLRVDATGGTYVLTYVTPEAKFATTSPISFSAGAGEVQTALEETVGPGRVTVSGQSGGPYSIEFVEPGEILPLEVDSSGLTGPSSAATITTTTYGSEGTGAVEVLLVNEGGAPTDGSPITVTDHLPPDLSFLGIRDPRGRPPCEESEPSVVTCVTSAVLAGDGRGDLAIPILVRATAGAKGAEINSVKVSGGGAGPSSATARVVFGPEAVPFGLNNFDFRTLDPEGHPETQAAGRPNLLGVGFGLSTVQKAYRPSNPESIETRQYAPPAEPKDVVVEFPVGLIGNPQAIAATCAQNLVIFEEGLECPAGIDLGVHLQAAYFPEYNSSADEGSDYSPALSTTPDFGIPFEFGLTDGFVPAPVYGSLVHTASGYAIRSASPNIPPVANLRGILLELWGDPNSLNGVGVPRPFYTNSSDCSASGLKATIHVDSWRNPAPLALNPNGSNDFESANFSEPEWVNETVEFPTPTGCEKLAFEPTLAARPTTIQAESPSGLEVDLKVPQDEEPEELATPPLKDAVVTLPKGVAIDPSSAGGLETCSAFEIDLEATRPGNCPGASRIGEVELRTPLLGHVLGGSMFLASPECSPCSGKDAEEGKLARLYLEINDPESGTFIKLPGFARLDPATGQISADFPNQPQLPFSDLKVKLKQGPRAPLVTPQACGNYETTSSLTPWSAPQSGPPATPHDEWSISSGAGGGACASESHLPGKVSFSAGTQSTQAGAYAPFVVNVSREDGTQRLTNLDLTLPPGLTGRLAGVAYCPQADIAAAEGKSGTAEKANPSCPSSSEVGTVDVAAGAGSQPYHVQGHAYLAGPYKGAPLSMVIVTPAVAGPFDLGTVVVRSALFVDPITTQITVKSDPIPTMLAGIPLDVRQISVDISRNQFTLNPTNCEKKTLGGQAGTTLGQTVSFSNSFQVGGCKGLGFKPSLKISLQGSIKHAGHPALKAVVTYPSQGAYANIARAQVNLPHSEFIDQGNLNKTCTKPVLLEGKCPATSIYGSATAWTPLLEKPLEGPVYLVGGFGYKLPALVAELNGQIRVLLIGKVDSGKNHGIRNTFEAVPDAPVSRFVLSMKGGKKYSLLENSEDLCKKEQRVSANFVAQSGASLTLHPKIANSCGKAKKKRQGGGHRAGKH